ncbi:hypothetical protein BDL97_01G130800 [Sphagnum fallax]|jgi:hypothetical protein|nr:hypothetical protein BDL97_01G130800 [Sphagnum fallax]KAH8974957.1 hypothetical protein BDL97_01G130800 [Sphagnum fallax]KAH8974958.1 hypothetical protein BDL97_01G130800 [Sphagnum fallax]
MRLRFGGGGGGGGGRGGANNVSWKGIMVLCLASFGVGLLFTNRMWSALDESEGVRQDCNPKPKPSSNNEEATQKDIFEEVSKTHQVIQTLDKTISSLELELATSRAQQENEKMGSIPLLENNAREPAEGRQKAFMVVGINTAFSSRKRRDSVRESWMPQGEMLKRLEQEKGIVVRFVIGHSATPGGILDRAIEAEDAQHSDFLRLNHVEGYLELSIKTKIFFTTAVNKWDADFYVKVDDDVHVNLGVLGTTLARHISKPRVYIGCMKSGPVLAQKGVKYHEPEYWKFGEEGNKYFRHATGQIYAISKELARYISVNQAMLHKYANEDVSLGSWIIGLDVDHVDDRSMCCGTPPDCEWKAQAGNVCVASFDWTCSGICKSVERIKEVHRRCGEGDGAVWNALLQ